MARVACLFSIEFNDTVEHPLPDWYKIPHGLSVIAACVERAGHDVRCWVVCPDTSLASTADEIVRQFGCDTVLASAVTTQFPLISRLCSHIKELKASIPILLGGVHASLRSEECLAHPAIDAICIGEGEDAAVAWVDAISQGRQPSQIPGAWIKFPGSSDIERTPPAPFRTNLDELPLVNYAHWERWVDPENRNVSVVVGRGCPYSCTYCSNHAIRRLQPGAYVRFRSPENILSEIDVLLRRFSDLTAIYFEIETIGESIPWVLQLCEHLAILNASRKSPIQFRANLAVTSQLAQDDSRIHELLSALRRANFVALNIGLESGSPRIRKDIMNRPPYTDADLIRFCRSAREHGIDVYLYVLVGVPTETPADALRTSAIARACQPQDIYPAVYYPYPGTRLHDLSAQMHLIDPGKMGTRAERSRVYLKLPGFPRWRVFFEFVVMKWRVFHGRRNPIWLIRITMWMMLGIVPHVFNLLAHAERALRRLRRQVKSVVLAR